MTDTPNPPVPANADLKDFPFTPMYRARLFGSAFHARATDAEWRAGVTLWLKSQDQVPAGSLPDDDIELCRLAELGRDLKSWKKIKEGALRGWYRCNDGRLYHDVVAEVVNEQWQGKLDQRLRTLKARVAALEKRLKEASDSQAKADIEAQIQKLRQALSQTSVTEPATASKRKGQGEGQGDSSSEAKASGAEAPPVGQSGKPELALEIPLWLQRPDDGDWSKLLWRQGLAALAELANSTPKAMRSFLGSCCQLAGDDHQRVFTLIAEAKRDGGKGEIKAWLTAMLGGKAGGTPHRPAGARTLPRQDDKTDLDRDTDRWIADGMPEDQRPNPAHYRNGKRIAAEQRRTA